MFYSKRESQKLDVKALQQEREAMKKLENIKKDHETRLQILKETQEVDKQKASLIETNKDLVDRALLVIRSALANQHSWEDIKELVQDAQDRGDPVARSIKKLKLDINHVTLELQNPYYSSDDSENEREEKGVLVDVDLSLGAYQNARKYYDFKKQAATKEQKTLGASKKALKSAEQKAMETLKQVQVRTTVNKQRKTFWFEKFLWVISSEDYLVIGGRDAQQNELIVKRYLKPGDVYVHADLRGASSVIVKNRNAGSDADTIPPKTLNEAGTMAVCFSAAWEAKVVSGAWWVRHDQVSKTAPSGEYLVPGSFMIRGKKNFLPPAILQMGWGFLFKLEEDSLERHKGERRKAEGRKDLMDSGGTEKESVDEMVELDSEASDNESPGLEEQKGDEEFPDVQVHLKSLTARSGEEESTIIQLGPRRNDPKVEAKRAADLRERMKAQEGKKAEEAGTDSKRGHRHRAKKAKEKYRDQDEEERQMRMEILGSAGQQKIKGKKNKKKAAAAAEKAERSKPRPLADRPLKPEDSTADSLENRADQEVTGDVKPGSSVENISEPKERNGEFDGSASLEGSKGRTEEDDDDMVGEFQDEMTLALGSLTGCPVAEDLLMFAVPVCAPYSAMSNYKFKVKLTPGTGKKGKATKTAIQMFISDKETTLRERDLLRAVMDQDLGRNMPGKVKVSAPNLMAHKQKTVKK